jgi:hypothetical protein
MTHNEDYYATSGVTGPPDDERPPLTAADRQFVFGHARAYARPELAEAYAEWYMGRYAGPHDTMDDLPAHTYAWPRFLDQYRPEGGSPS